VNLGQTEKRVAADHADGRRSFDERSAFIADIFADAAPVTTRRWLRLMSTTERGEARMERMSFSAVNASAYRAMKAMQNYVNDSGLEHSLLELVKLRASYMNGCAHCVDMHTKDAVADGETPQRLFAVPVWRETPFFSARERAALAWTEVVTNIDAGVGDTQYEAALAHFDPAELVDLTLAIVAINGWNRLSIAFQSPVGTYQPRKTLPVPVEA
jgi:AhpD family alkylhydroperoxidase